jgi:hypothetical protein
MLLTVCYCPVLLACAAGVCYWCVQLVCATDHVLLPCATGVCYWRVLLACATGVCCWRVLLACATAVCYCRVLLPCVLLRVLLATRASDKLHCFEAMDYIANALNALAQHVDQRPE